APSPLSLHDALPICPFAVATASVCTRLLSQLHPASATRSASVIVRPWVRNTCPSEKSSKYQSVGIFGVLVMGAHLCSAWRLGCRGRARRQLVWPRVLHGAPPATAREGGAPAPGAARAT